MLRRRFVLAVPSLLAGLGAPARAAEGGGAKTVGQYVDLQPLMLPVVADGRLQNYVYVSVRMNLSPGADPSYWRTKEPFFRDALVQLGYKTPFTMADDYEKLDAAKLSSALLKAVTPITGPGVIRSIEVTAQTPSRHVRRPRS